MMGDNNSTNNSFEQEFIQGIGNNPQPSGNGSVISENTSPEPSSKKKKILLISLISGALAIIIIAIISVTILNSKPADKFSSEEARTAFIDFMAYATNKDEAVYEYYEDDEKYDETFLFIAPLYFSNEYLMVYYDDILERYNAFAEAATSYENKTIKTAAEKLSHFFPELIEASRIDYYSDKVAKIVYAEGESVAEKYVDDLASKYSSSDSDVQAMQDNFASYLKGQIKAYAIYKEKGCLKESGAIDEECYGEKFTAEDGDAIEDAYTLSDYSARFFMRYGDLENRAEEIFSQLKSML